MLMFSKRFVVTVFQNHGNNVDFVQKKVRLSWRENGNLGMGKLQHYCIYRKYSIKVNYKD